MKCDVCLARYGSLYYAHNDVADAAAKFRRKQNVDTHARLLEAKAKRKDAQEHLDAHLAEHPVEVTA